MNYLEKDCQSEVFSRSSELEVIEKKLDSYEQVIIDRNMPLYELSDNKNHPDLPGQVIAEIDAGGQPFLLVDNIFKGESSVLVVDPNDFSSEEKRGYKGLRPEKELVIGRAQKDRFEYLPTVSKEHFKVFFNEYMEVVVQNFDPKNSTHLTYARLKEGHLVRYDDEIGERTYDAIARVALGEDFKKPSSEAPNGYHKGHPILGMNSSKINEGVYLGGSAREAIVVDGNAEVIRSCYKSLYEKLRLDMQDQHTLPEAAILVSIKDTVRKMMKYDEDRVLKLSAPYFGDELINLSEYVKEGVGVCRHMGLLAAHLTERLIEDKMLGGSVGVQRNRNYQGAHGWSVFRNSRGVEYVIDPAQNYVGSKQNAKKQGRWNYDIK